MCCFDDSLERVHRGDWQNGINVRDFIQRNYTPYTGDGAFLAGPTARTLELRGKMDDLLRRERENGGVLKVDTETVITPTSFGPGYLDRKRRSSSACRRMSP